MTFTDLLPLSTGENMSTQARRRLVKDLEKLRNEPAHGVSAAPLEE
jgi:ubiquitin-protein ligase